jgi:hypothetical protein
MTQKSKKFRPVKERKVSKTVPKATETKAVLLPDAWERFEKAVDIAVVTKPMHRETTKPMQKR